MRRAEALDIPRRQRLCKLNHWPPPGGIDGFHARPGHRAMHAQANRLGEGLFGAKAGCQEADATPRIAAIAALKNLDFRRPQNTVHKLVTEPVEHTLNAV